MAGSVHLYVTLHGPDHTAAPSLWLPCLEIPIDRLATFSLKAYRWLYYAGYCIMGIKGSLSFSPMDLGATDFNCDVPFESTFIFGLYFHPHGAIFPIDPDIGEGSFTADSENQVSAFRTLIVECDRTCVVTDDPALHCDVVHLISHNKGSEYIEHFTLQRDFHFMFGHNFAILQAPNFIIKTNDIVPGITPDDDRWTMHDFAEPMTRTAHLSTGILADKAVRTPSTGQHCTWPPHCLFAAVYALALLMTWPVKEFLMQVRSMWMEIFYPGSHKAISDQQKAERKKKVEKSNRGNEQGDDIDIFDVLLMLHEMCAYNMACKPRFQPSSAQKTHEDVQEKVLPCLQGLHDSNILSEHL
ncbi:hypothetical protein ARMGADRAFT_1087671 [Armillaria gallica]|uniref:HNH nuclease domain-containing protein n=1 Tax=Armillaria gallica TaxID=47427 RepID=A0A2H3CUU8_ARMGA|nr:hypothetical protein ARMGADRAFT_1087671 [Armillaria gallica]